MGMRDGYGERRGEVKGGHELRGVFEERRDFRGEREDAEKNVDEVALIRLQASI